MSACVSMKCVRLCVCVWVCMLCVHALAHVEHGCAQEQERKESEKIWPTMRQASKLLSTCLLTSFYAQTERDVVTKKTKFC